MSLPSGRLGLDLLDAHVQALRDGVELPLPEVPPGPAAGGADQLVRWAVGRIQGIPREPKHDFALQAGDLLAGLRSRRCPWNAAALRLLDDPYNFAATGPRRHEDWAHDVIAVLHRSAPVPRGWVGLDWDRTNADRYTVPAYPFDPPAASQFPCRLYPLESGAAVAVVAVMTEE